MERGLEAEPDRNSYHVRNLRIWASSGRILPALLQEPSGWLLSIPSCTSRNANKWTQARQRHEVLCCIFTIILLRWIASGPQKSTYKRPSQAHTLTFLVSLTHICSLSTKINWTIRGIMSLTGPMASSLKIMVIGKRHRNYDICRKHKVGQILWRTVRPRITTQQALRSRWLATDI